MITYLQHKEIDKVQWDDCIARSQYPIVYAESWYLDIVSPNWAAYVIEVENKYTAIFPLTEKSKVGFKYLVQPPFCQQLGLFYSEDTVLEPFVDLLKKRYTLIEIALNASNKLATSDSSVRQRLNLELNLNTSYERIYIDYSLNRKRDLKKAGKQGVFVAETNNIDFFIDFFRREKGLDINGLNHGFWQILKRIYEQGVEKSAIKLSFAYNVFHEICAVGLFVKRNQRIIFLLGTSNKEGQKNGSMTLLMDYVIRKNCNSNIVLDFEGSMIPGVAKFYESLGGKEKKYISLKASRLPVLLKFLQKMKGFIS